MSQKQCKNCVFGKPAGYRQVICKKTNTFQAELYSCKRHKDRTDPKGNRD